MVTQVPDIDRLIGYYLYGRDIKAYRILSRYSYDCLNDMFWYSKLVMKVGSLDTIRSSCQVYYDIEPLSCPQVGVYAIENDHPSLLRAVLAKMTNKQPQLLDTPPTTRPSLRKAVVVDTAYFRLALDDKIKTLYCRCTTGDWTNNVYLYVLLAARQNNLDALRLIHQYLNDIPSELIDIILLQLVTEPCIIGFVGLFEQFQHTVGAEELLQHHSLCFYDIAIRDYLVDRLDCCERRSMLSNAVDTTDLGLLERLIKKIPSRKKPELLRLMLAKAIFNESFETITYLLNEGTRTDQIEILSAIETKSYEIVHILINHGLRTRKDDFKALQFAVDNQLVNILRLLLESGVDPSPIMSSLIIKPCRLGQIDIMRLLIQYGQKDTIRAHRDSALRIATYNGHIELVNLLLESGADPHVAMPNAYQKNNQKMIELLRSKIMANRQ